MSFQFLRGFVSRGLNFYRFLRAAEVSNKAARVVKLSFIGISFVQHVGRTDDFGQTLSTHLHILRHSSRMYDEYADESQTSVDDAQFTNPPLLQQIQQHMSLDKLEIGKQLGQGCFAAVFEAKLRTNDTDESANEQLVESNIEQVLTSNNNSRNTEIIYERETQASLKDGGQTNTSVEVFTENVEREKHNLAVKMMFNYFLSNESEILTKNKKEMVPARFVPTDEQIDTRQNVNTLPPHPNIVEIHGAFVDDVLDSPEGRLNYPDALPAPIGVGKNKTMFLFMKKYHCTLEKYLLETRLSMRDRLILLAQVFEGLDHMRRHNVAHRDLKLDNIFLDTSKGGVPHLVIGDFGCCLYGRLQIEYKSEDVSKGGNCCLMAPEISSAVPGEFSVLDYRKSDLWAAGTLAYQILGADNPFYANESKVKLDSRTYAENDLPPLPDDVPEMVKHLIKAILNRDPEKRPTARLSADALHVILWAPSDWLSPGKIVSKTEWKSWKISMETEVHVGAESSDELIKRRFLHRFKMEILEKVSDFFGKKEGVHRRYSTSFAAVSFGIVSAMLYVIQEWS